MKQQVIQELVACVLVQQPIQYLKRNLTLTTYGFLFHFMLVGVQEDKKKTTCPSQTLGKFFNDALKMQSQSIHQNIFKKCKNFCKTCSKVISTKHYFFAIFSKLLQVNFFFFIIMMTQLHAKILINCYVCLIKICMINKKICQNLSIKCK